MRLAWWNTGLAKKKGRGPREKIGDTRAVAVGQEVIRGLENDRVDVLVLGEVSHYVGERLREGTRYVELAVPDLMAEAGLALLFDATSCAAKFDEIVAIPVRKRIVGRGARFSILAASSPVPLWLIAVHWPSRRQAEEHKSRLVLGRGVQEVVGKILERGTDADSYGIVCGDFNDEPFSDSMTTGLLGTRDRRFARAQATSLYNPFWRLLGERQPHENAATWCGAGTYFWRSGWDTNWYTFDQFLFTPPFLKEGSWRLVESETAIWHKSPLATDRGIARPFDHFPVVVEILPKAQGGSK